MITCEVVSINLAIEFLRKKERKKKKDKKKTKQNKTHKKHTQQQHAQFLCKINKLRIY